MLETFLGRRFAPSLRAFSIAVAAFVALPPAAQAGDLAAALSPSARAAALPANGEGRASVFATVINTAASPRRNCRVIYAGSAPVRLSFRRADPLTSQPIGAANAPFALAARGAAALIVTVSASAPYAGEIAPSFLCEGGSYADAIPGVSTLHVRFARPGPPDLVPVAIALPSNDGVARIAQRGGSQAVALAVSNLGAGGRVNVAPQGAYPLNGALPASLFICETEPSGACRSAILPRLDITFAAGQTRTFTTFIVADRDRSIAYDPATTRVFIEFADGGGLLARASVAVTAPGPRPVNASLVDAVRLAKQATFGPDHGVVEDIRQRGVEGWVDRQLALATSSYRDIAARVVPVDYCLRAAPPPNCYRDHMTALPVQMRFYANALREPDQLRQRMAFALSQILVVSENEVQTSYGQAAYQQILLDHAFGNYRDLLRAVAMNPLMGEFLDMVNSAGGAPNENFARELLQLFAMGEARLEIDGAVRLDRSGREVPAYDESDVMEIARALTGWVHPPRPGQAARRHGARYFDAPMVAVPAHHDSGAKSFLGTSAPAGQSPQADLESVLDAVFHHPNTAPFISKQLIQHLVASNPSPGYVRRVANVFQNNGRGVRGDLGAVARAILLDPEARGWRRTGQAAGKLKEPVLLMTAAARLAGMRSDGYAFTRRHGALLQRPFAAPSVFNFYPPDAPLPRGRGLVSPPTTLLSTATSFERHNLIADWTLTAAPSHADFQPLPGAAGSTGARIDWSPWAALAGSPDALLDALDAYALGGALAAPSREAIKAAMAARVEADPLRQAEMRARTAFYLVTSSPYFQVDQ